MEKANLAQADLHKLNGSDPRKIILALFLRNKTTVSNGWIAEHLEMKSAWNVSRLLTKTNVKKLINKLPGNLIDYVKVEGFKI